MVCVKTILCKCFLYEKKRRKLWQWLKQGEQACTLSVWQSVPLDAPPTICGTKLCQNKGGTAGPNSLKLILRGHEIQSRKGLRQVQ